MIGYNKCNTSGLINMPDIGMTSTHCFNVVASKKETSSRLELIQIEKVSQEPRCVLFCKVKMLCVSFSGLSVPRRIDVNIIIIK